MIYPVAEIFASLQGEGHFVGYRMAFVRLGGCSVTECRIRAQCDEAPWKVNFKLRACDIADKLRALGPFTAVCITGGEPTDHDLLPLICELRDRGWPVHLETSGVRSVAGYPLEWVTVSPKVNNFIQRTGHTFKLVVMPEWERGIPGFSDAWSIIKGAADCTSFFHYYLQPLYGEDGKPTNLDQVLALIASEHNGRGKWALSMQSHKAWGLK